MEEYTEILIAEVIKIFIPAFVVAVVLLVIFLGTHKVLKNLDALKYKWIVRGIVIIVFLFDVLWAYNDTHSIIVDIRDEAYVSYNGEIEYLENKSSEYTDVYRLCEESSLNVTAEIGTINANIQRCTAHVIYSKNSKYILELEVYDVLETRSPTSVRW